MGLMGKKGLTASWMHDEVRRRRRRREEEQQWDDVVSY